MNKGDKAFLLILAAGVVVLIYLEMGKRNGRPPQSADLADVEQPLASELVGGSNTEAGFYAAPPLAAMLPIVGD